MNTLKAMNFLFNQGTLLSLGLIMITIATYGLYGFYKALGVAGFFLVVIAVILNSERK